ncbi:ribosome maturation factor RimP [Algoriphagus kandeliae]|uniref:Ribosome maturation factor RimP n=1 Tax=Algoriphagus kandeliae TaxID=2562278 RepID=A0A4Y9QLY0_9BACT|nr:ribosome maturation factor RimP [Algoriphagus kandeliae]TFV93711.1 ribosome maturation factor RimP [Algoriphagus kandeliae]
MEDLKQKLIELVERNLPDEEHFLVDLQLTPKKDQMNLNILIDADQGLTIDSCAKVSRLVSEEIEALDLIDSAYRIEVSSPGVDFPLSSIRQYRKNVGRELKVLLADGKEQKGKLLEVNVEGILLSVKVKEKGKKAVEMELPIAYDEIKKSVVQVSFK